MFTTNLSKGMILTGTRVKSYQMEKTSKALYLLPFCLLFIGGIIMYAMEKNKIGNRARNGLIFGFVWTPIALIFPFMLISMAFVSSVDTEELNKIITGDPTKLEFYEDMDCGRLAEEVKWQRNGLQMYAMAGDKESIKFYRTLNNYYNEKC